MGPSAAWGDFDYIIGGFMKFGFYVSLTVLMMSGSLFAAHADTAFGINCDFDADPTSIENSLRSWADPGTGGVEVGSADEGIAVLQGVIKSGDINQIIVSKTAVTLANPKVIFTIRSQVRSIPCARAP
jgi:hypothetical protein